MYDEEHDAVVSGEFLSGRSGCVVLPICDWNFDLSCVVWRGEVFMGTLFLSSRLLDGVGTVGIYHRN